MYATRPRFVIQAACAAILLCLTSSGCKDWGKKINWPTWPGRQDPNSPSAETGDPSQDPQTQPASEDANAPPLSPKDAEIQRLRTDISLLRGELAELRVREKRLVDEVNQLKFLNTQLQAQVKALADAPGQRDKLMEKVKLLRAEIEALKKRLPKLPKPASAPAPSTTSGSN